MTTLTVMTINIRRQTEEDGEDNWPFRRPLVARLIHEVRPTLFGTQEGRRPQLYSLLSALPDYGLSDRHRKWDPKRFYPTIFFRKDRVDILESGDRWLSETPDVHASKSWGSAFPRLATWALCRERGSQADFLFACVHLDHLSPEARKGQAGVLVELLSEKNPGRLPVILVGDFNDLPGSEPYRILTRSLKDAWSGTGLRDTKEEGTWHGFSGKAERGRLDWILVSPDMIVQETRILRTSYDGHFPSDHFPVLARVAITDHT